MDNKEFYIDCDGVRIHAKLDFPETGLSETDPAGTIPASGYAAAAFEEITSDSEEIAPFKMPLVIVVHGFTGHMEERHIREVARVLTERGCAALRVDMYGHGKSEGSFGKHHLLLWISELIRIIDFAAELNFVNDIYLAGHSQGGAAIVLAGAVMQDKIKAIMPLAPALNLKDGAQNGNFLGCLFDPDHLPETIEHGEGYILESNHLRVDRFLPFDEAAASFKKPVLLVHSPSDPSVPFSCSLRLKKLFTDARLIAIPDDTHCFDRHLDRMAAAVSDFFDEVNRPCSSI